jgi:MFS family permease
VKLSLYRPTRRAELLSVGSTYAVQGLGYAVIVTSLPAIQARQSLDATMIALILLGVTLAAAGGSVLADAIAIRRNSKAALLSGLAAQSAGFFVMATAQPAPIYVGAVLLFGVGLGAVDASTAMQGVLVQRGRPRPLLGRFFAAYTLAGIVGAFLMVALVETPAGAGAVLAIVGVVDVLVIVAGWRLLDTGHAARNRGHGRDAARIPRWPVFVIGALILAAFVADSAVSTWSSVYLSGTLQTAASAAPLGYAAYQIVVLISRLGVDYLARRTARAAIATAAIVLGGIGFVVIAFIPTMSGAIVGFALTGVIAGVLVPLAFGAAGDVLPSRSDEIIARVNLFNYAGALLGTVIIGVVADQTGFGPAFLIPLAILILVLPATRVLRATRKTRQPG